MTKVIGIDLGTANSCVAVLHEGEVVVVPDAEGNRTMPSLVTINASKEPIVGWHAQRQADVNRLNTIFAAKRLIGRKYGSREVQEFAEKVPYKIISSSNGDAWVEINGEPQSPEEISSHILIKLREQAEAFYNEPIHHAVITVPAHFNDVQRQATKDAGKIAGLQVLGIINEPTAAALAYGLDINNASNGEPSDRICAVFDVGSGTFDVTILQLKNGVFDVLATGGDTYLGGEDFDIAMMNYLMQEFKKTEGVDLSKDRSVLQRLKEAGRQAKQDLSTQFSVEVFIPYICKGDGKSAPRDLKIQVDRKTFERVCGDLLDRLEGPCLQALADANLKPQDVTDCILVGGMTRMPAIKQRCQLIFGKMPIDTINPDEAVASGAAIQAALLQGVLQGMKLADVTSLSLGIETQGGKMAVLLPRNTKIPSKVSEVVTTSAPNQTSVTIHLLQGEHDFVPENKSLGRFELSGINAAPRGVPRIEVTLEVDGDGIVHISANDLDSGLKKELQIMNSSGLSDDEVNQKVLDNRKQAAYKQRRAEEEKRLKKMKEGHVVTDDTFGELTNAAKLELKSAIFETQFKLDTEGKRLRGERRNKLDRILATARKTLESSNDMSTIQDALASIKSIAEELSGYLEAA